MSWQLVFAEQYNRRAARFLNRHSEIESVCAKALRLLEANTHHPPLRLHPLKGRLGGLHGVSINMSYRITLEMIFTDKEIILINVGKLDEGYR